MGRIKQRWKRILFWVLISPLLLVLLVAGLLYLPPIQQWAVGIATQKASEATGMQIGIGRIRLGFPLLAGHHSRKGAGRHTGRYRLPTGQRLGTTAPPAANGSAGA